MVHLTSVVGTVQGHLVVGRLRTEGVDAVMTGTGDGPYPFPAEVQILVPESQLESARRSSRWRTMSRPCSTTKTRRQLVPVASGAGGSGGEQAPELFAVDAAECTPPVRAGKDTDFDLVCAELTVRSGEARDAGTQGISQRPVRTERLLETRRDRAASPPSTVQFSSSTTVPS